VSPALVIAIANAGIMALVAVAAPRLPQWSRGSSWLLLLLALAVLGLHLVADAWGIPSILLAIAFLVSTCLNASALAPLIMQGLLARRQDPRRAVE
jgi:hypothetical protein